jgi:aryl-alcohol dehydrogenase-like predicted oxidoreductase
LLTGKHPHDRPVAGSFLDTYEWYHDRYWHPAYFAAVDELKAVAAKAGISMVELSLGWLLHHTAADCIILGATSIKQLEENLAAFGKGPLPAEVVAGCDGVWNKLRGITPNYNR